MVSRRQGSVRKNRKTGGVGAGEYFTQVGTGWHNIGVTMQARRRTLEDRHRTEGFGRSTRNKYPIIKHHVGAGGQAGGGNSVVEARGRQHWSLAGDKSHEGGPYAQLIGVCRLGEGGGEQALGGICGGMDIGSEVEGGEHYKLWTKRGKFLVDMGS